MVPAAFVLLESLPLTPNGKIDRKALPVPEIDATEGNAKYVAPRTNVEERLTNIWESVLKHSPIGVHDNFFDLGGHSLLAATLVAKVEREFGRHLRLATLFRSPTVAELAALIEEPPRDLIVDTSLQEETGTPWPMPPVAAMEQPVIPKTDRGAPLPLSFAQERLWFLEIGRAHV